MNQKKVVRPIKKIAQDVDNSLNYSEKRYKMICQIQQLLKEGCSYREIARRMGVGRNTIAKYRTGEPRELSMYGIHQSKLDIYHDFILYWVIAGKDSLYLLHSFIEPPSFCAYIFIKISAIVEFNFLFLDIKKNTG